ncbi:SCO family protein [Rhodanobacter denitrificans]|uniref:Uncharacterized protein SCO1/SenC/PrrC, involved in biogenesis of respiratory and photosynthetic systems n=1 Tax=Rhodanobacter denitrificans TaxID=666685 RepID=U3GKC6_9GAMM|nr:SCO family protein [Rhodanobacter denitrificans]AGG88827.1 uncharacterized protein SCO1/SenC/PrrC, involved in biogenesis of respiratory and photosynthetic systems [Rhodanobacter denitrificans]ODV27272.1 MAG: hypothetical protein ABT19_02080 [Rhodanobacter sp. SCN 68-63]UJM87953.1 SCO family protein [Rhodanobacter denitrificans]
MNTTALRTGLALAALASFALVAFADVTCGFAAITSEGARRVAIERAPRAVPDIELVDSHAQRVRFADLRDAAGRVLLVSLVYTQCETICRTTASGQAWLQRELRHRGLGERVHLVTLSFDPARDTPAALRAYARGQRADASLWTFATVADPAQLDALLRTFGIVVLRDEFGGYTHNAALFRLDAQGRIDRVYDVDRPNLALADLLRD